MMDVGYRSDGTPVTLVIAAPKDESGAFAYYEPGQNRVVLSRCAAGETGIVFREFSHHVLLRSLSFDYDKANNMVLNAIETGLVSYFACSYQNEPTLGRQQDASSNAAMINLENKKSLASAGSLKMTDLSSMYDVGEAWGGLFWDVRRVVGAALADQIMFAAWHELPPPERRPSYAVEMTQKILAQVRARASEQMQRDVRAIIGQRDLTL
jgi:hypothetical protein